MIVNGRGEFGIDMIVEWGLMYKSVGLWSGLSVCECKG